MPFAWKIERRVGVRAEISLLYKGKTCLAWSNHFCLWLRPPLECGLVQKVMAVLNWKVSPPSLKTEQALEAMPVQESKQDSEKSHGILMDLGCEGCVHASIWRSAWSFIVVLYRSTSGRPCAESGF